MIYRDGNLMIVKYKEIVILSWYILKLKKKIRKKIIDWCFYLFFKLFSCMKCDKIF